MASEGVVLCKLWCYTVQLRASIFWIRGVFHGSDAKKSALSVNMTEGSLWKNMLLFSLPLMLTQVLEVLFNLSDVAIAGKFADYRALGAVGSTTLLVSLFTGLLIGMGSGVNVAVARGLGMGDRQRVEKPFTRPLCCAPPSAWCCA